MSKYDVLTSIHKQFREAAKELCDKNNQVNDSRNVQQNGIQNVGQKDVKNVKQNFKSCAQVGTCVGQNDVRHKSSELKLKGRRIHRITTRFNFEEKMRLIEKAKESCLRISDYIRASVLGAGYVSAIDPTKNQLLMNIQSELNKQGSNLNQIAKQLNAGIVNPFEGNNLLSMLARSLLNAHNSVRKALSEGRTME